MNSLQPNKTLSLVDTHGVDISIAELIRAGGDNDIGVVLSFLVLLASLTFVSNGFDIEIIMAGLWYGLLSYCH